MTCTSCNSKRCRAEARDCFGVKQQSLSVYASQPARKGALSASALVDGGRAGTLDRLQEIIEYCQRMGYARVGVAYCFGLPDHARLLEARLKEAGLEPIMVQCSTGGVREREIDPRKTTEAVSCNPAGQALALEKKGAQFVIELGLCMGHDVLLHQMLRVPFTTFLVKDRVHGHNPAKALGPVADPMARFLVEMDDKMRMVSDVRLREWLEQHETPRPAVLDVRSEEAFRRKHIPGSLHAPLRDLPARHAELLPDKRRPVVCVCQGSVQSAYAVAFLYERGFREVFNLSGGFSKWEGQGHPVHAAESEAPTN